MYSPALADLISLLVIHHMDRIWKNTEDIYFGHHYISFSGTKDLFTCFIENSLQLLCSTGVLSYIVPSAWVGGPQYTKLRKLLLTSD